MKTITKLAVLILLFTFALNLNAQNRGKISGVILDIATQKPIVNAKIVLSDSNYTTNSDRQGNFTLLDVEYKTYTIEIIAEGYKLKNLNNITVTAGNEFNLNIELESTTTSLSEVVVSSNKRSAKVASLETPLSVQRLTSEEIKSNPGGNFDISKVIQTLPGVGGGVSNFRNDIIIRGGAPNENVFYLDGIEIPVINHFQTQGSSGGPQGMLNVSFIEDVKLSSSAFDAKYDNAMSSVFQFKQRNGNPNKLQGNFRLSATEVAGTLEGPLLKDKKTTFLASARRSYLQFLFSALDLPIRPSFWDFQAKITHKFDDKNTLSFVGIGAIDDFRFAPVKKATPEKLYLINANALISQWNYTFGFTFKHLLNNGYLNIALSRNSFDNAITQFEDNETKIESQQILDFKSRETENKLRFDVNTTSNGWKTSYGFVAQLAEYNTAANNVIRKQFVDNSGNTTQPEVRVIFTSPLKNFIRLGAFAQVSKRFLEDRLGLSAGIRTDINTFTKTGNNGTETLSPRISASYTLSEKWTLNASVGRYYKIAPYTILGFADNMGTLVNKDSKYLQSDHYVTGLEFLPNSGLRFTAEVFYKSYNNVPISVRNGISLSNLGSNFEVLGNEAVITNGTGNAYGFEFFAQKKLTERFFGIFSYTFYKSQYAGSNGNLVASSWDNRHLISITAGYKFSNNWELGSKLRLQGGAPYTPYDENASRTNYLSLGKGVLDYNQLNTQRLQTFISSDVRIDKKWNFKKTTLDLFLDVTNWTVAKSIAVPSYTFKRNDANTAFVTTDNLPIQSDGSNAIPVQLKNDEPRVTPSIGFIYEF